MAIPGIPFKYITPLQAVAANCVRRFGSTIIDRRYSHKKRGALSGPSIRNHKIANGNR